MTCFLHVSTHTLRGNYLKWLLVRGSCLRRQYQDLLCWWMEINWWNDSDNHMYSLGFGADVKCSYIFAVLVRYFLSWIAFYVLGIFQINLFFPTLLQVDKQAFLKLCFSLICGLGNAWLQVAWLWEYIQGIYHYLLAFDLYIYILPQVSTFNYC